MHQSSRKVPYAALKQRMFLRSCPLDALFGSTGRDDGQAAAKFLSSQVTGRQQENHFC